MTKLPEEKYWKLILLRGMGLSQEEIAYGFDVSRQTVAYALKKIKRKYFLAFDGDAVQTLAYYHNIGSDF